MRAPPGQPGSGRLRAIAQEVASGHHITPSFCTSSRTKCLIGAPSRRNPGRSGRAGTAKAHRTHASSRRAGLPSPRCGRREGASFRDAVGHEQDRLALLYQMRAAPPAAPSRVCASSAPNGSSISRTGGCWRARGRSPRAASCRRTIRWGSSPNARSPTSGEVMLRDRATLVFAAGAASSDRTRRWRARCARKQRIVLKHDTAVGRWSRNRLGVDQYRGRGSAVQSRRPCSTRWTCHSPKAEQAGQAVSAS